MDFPTIDKVEVATYRLPTDAPEADGTLRWDATELVVVHVEAGGQRGMGYSYTAAKAAASLIKDKLAPCLLQKNVFDLPARWADMNHVLRNVGRPGLGLMAIAAVDVALWDLKARLLGVPLASLWGQARPSVKAYGSGGFVTYSDQRLRNQLADWVEQGFRSVKIKIGDDIERAEHRVELARSLIGPETELMVDANGACHKREAAALMARLAGYGICWMEEPVSSDHLQDLSWLRDRAPPSMAIAAGEYGWDGIYFRRMLETGSVDILQADATRCGYTGFMQAAQLCEAYAVPISAHCAPALHLPLCVAVPKLCHLEYFHDHVRLEAKLFDSGQRLQDTGHLLPATDRPGHGIELRKADAEAFRM